MLNSAQEGDAMKKIIVAVIAIAASATLVSASAAEAKGKSARATCLARAGVTEQEWQQRRASYAQGAVVKACMTEHGQDITVRRRDGSVLY
jgi:Ni/Co efflux regulator RcnB